MFSPYLSHRKFILQQHTFVASVELYAAYLKIGKLDNEVVVVSLLNTSDFLYLEGLLSLATFTTRS